MDEISAIEHSKQTVTVKGRTMAYVEMGEGDPIIFLHGNPTSSYLWRNIMGHVKDLGRCIAPDLIGMGDSEKLPGSGPNSYRFVEHRDYLDGFLNALGVTENITFVVHDWGSALGFDWLRWRPKAVKGVCYMEAIVTPITWAEWPDDARPVFQGLRSEAGDEMILQKNLFVERVLPGSIIRDLTDDEMTVYRRPYLNPGEDRRPTLTWPREIPIEGEPADVFQIVGGYGSFLSRNQIPKLFINAEPGAILVGTQRDFCRTWPNQTEVTVKGTHFLQEDSPHEIGAALRDWMAGGGEADI